MLEVNQENFEQEVLKSDIPVVIDLWAPWCAPCRMISPIFEQLGPNFDGKVKMVKMDIDQSPDIAAKYNISSIPTFLAFRGGEVVDKKVGALSRTGLSDFISQFA